MATAAQPRPAGVEPPARFLAWSEPQRALLELAALPLASPLLATAPRGDGHPVLVLPGMLASDRSTGVLRTYLANLGYEVHKWELGRNLGARAIGIEGERLIERLSTIHRANGGKVSLIGWSLGGAFAQLLGRRLPEHVRSVITLGSPLRGDPRASNVWRIYEMATGDRVDSARTTRQRDEIAAPPEVPTTAIFSKADGVVPWWNCQVTEGPTAENVEVYGSHCGLGVNAAALYVIADRLAQKPGEWRRFAPMALAAPLYPRARAS